MAAADGTGAGARRGSRALRREPNHGLRIFLIWLPIALAADLLIWFVWGPHMPPGDLSSSASSQQFDIKDPGSRRAGPGAPSVRPWWRRPAIHTGVLGAVLGYLLGHWLGNFIAGGYTQIANSGQNDFAIIFGYVLGTVGWLAGLGSSATCCGRWPAGRCTPTRRPGPRPSAWPGTSGTRWTTRWSVSST